MKKVLVFLLIFMLTGNVFSNPKDTINYKNGIVLNLESWLFHDFKITYTHKIGKLNYLETMLSYSYPYSEDSYIADNYFWRLYDPFFYYGRGQVRVGIKQYFKKRYYLGLMLSYGYGHFTKRDASWTYEGFHKFISRDRNELELIFKNGWTFKRNHLLQDLYFGFGIKYKIFNDVVFGDDYEDTSTYLPHPPYPYHLKDSYFAPSFHLGYQIGYCK